MQPTYAMLPAHLATILPVALSTAFWTSCGLAFGVLVGMAMAWRGWRGGVIDDHPLCRKCGYDLSGAPQGSALCPECGRDVQSPKSRRIGHRAARRRLLGSGLAMFLLCGGSLGTIGYLQARQIDPQQYKPVWWLLREAHGPTPQTADAALKELLDRLVKRRLSDEQITQIVDRALQVQADGRATWRYGWEAIVDEAHERKAMPASTYDRYLQQSVIVRLEINPAVRQGAAFPWRIVVSRRGTPGEIHVVSVLELDGQKMEMSRWPKQQNWNGSKFSGPYSFSWLVPAEDNWLSRQELGAHRAKLTATVKIHERSTRQPGGAREDPPSANTPELARVTATIELPWQLVREATVRPVSDPALAAQLIQSMSVHLEDSIGLSISLPAPPTVPLAFEVYKHFAPLPPGSPPEFTAPADYLFTNFLWDPKTQIKLGSFTHQGGAGMQAESFIFRSSAKVAESVVGMTEYWEGEVAIPVFNPPPASEE